ncbi:right-handed parallel beta-helix repeat-containing protein [Streptomyces sp. NBC_01275]|uniref:right-handed parallel beta-helix repeat-containing protein n=1 Tax=Streptomyces sp. NBC_01275 TaxID=2903807 RepID=UPI00225735E4|nr:right-handed parallel beta-helix repeat-containing protein [Streptomyces sp. NBC_01275]MCX4766214.1 right-handed parallel beta-helix repeat-containing protein [Streptomyces sp. NBC_01275]
MLDSGAVAVFATQGAAVRVDGCRISGGNVGIALVDRARGRFTRIDVEDLTNVALRVRYESKAVFEGIRVERCPAGLETLGNGGTTAELTDARFRDFDLGAVAAGGESRVTLKGVTAHRGQLGFGAVEEAQLHLHDCEVGAVRLGGASREGGRRSSHGTSPSPARRTSA